MPTVTLEVAIVLVLVVMNGILAMSEIAIVSARRARLQHRAEAGDSRAATALDLADEPNRFLATVQIGITLVGILAGAFGGARISTGVADWLQDVAVIGPYADAVAFVLVVSVITYLQLVIGELVPKRLGLQNPEGVASMVAKPMNGISRITTPLVWLLGVSTDFVLRLLRVRSDDGPVVTEEEVTILLRQGTQAGVFEHSEQEMVQEIFELSDRIVAEIMTPRLKVVSIDRDATLDEIRQIVDESEFSVFPVIDGDLDHILGVVSVRDLWRGSMSDGEFDLNELLTQPLYVPDSLPALQLLEDFQQAGQDQAFVVNEYGGVEGLVTFHDVVEEIVGELEHPGNDPQIVQREDGSWLVDGLVSLFEVDELVEQAALEAWSEDRYQTLGGFIMGESGGVPSVGDVVVWGDLRFEVVDMDGVRVDRILISHNPTQESSEE